MNKTLNRCGKMYIHMSCQVQALDCVLDHIWWSYSIGGSFCNDA